MDVSASENEPRIKKAFSVQKSEVLCTAVCSNNGFFAAGLSSGNINLFPEDPSLKAVRLSGHKGPIRCLKSSENAPFLASGGDDGTIRFWGEEKTMVSLGGGPILSMSITSSFDRILAVTKSNSASIWDVSNLSKIVDLETFSGEQATSCSMSDTGIIAMGSNRGTFKVYNWRTGTTTHNISIGNPITATSILRDGSKVAIGCENGAIYVWDLKTQAFSGRFLVHKSAISSLDFHISGDFLVASSHDKSISIFDVYGNKQKFTLQCHTQQALCAQFSPNGNSFSSCGADQRVILWDCSSLQRVNKKQDEDEDEEEEVPENDYSELDRKDILLSSSQEIGQQSEMKQMIDMLHNITDEIVSLSKTMSSLETRMNEMDQQIEFLENEKRRQAKQAIARAHME